MEKYGKGKKGNSEKGLINSLYAIYRQSAVVRGLSFGLTKNQFIKLTKGNCHYCGEEPSQEFRRSHSDKPYIYNGIDRMDNAIGYVFENCVSCCGMCNMAKRDISTKDFREWINRTYKHIFTEEDTSL